MFDQITVDRLLALEKTLTESGSIDFPPAGQTIQLEVTSIDRREAFLST